MCSTHDDIFCLFNVLGKRLRDRLFKKFQEYVEIDNLGPVSWALNTLILRDRKNGILKISQAAYTSKILKKHCSQPGVLGSSLSPTPCGNYSSPPTENSN